MLARFAEGLDLIKIQSLNDLLGEICRFWKNYFMLNLFKQSLLRNQLKLLIFFNWTWRNFYSVDATILQLQVQIVFFLQNYWKDFRKKGQFQAHLVQYWKFVLFLKIPNFKVLYFVKHWLRMPFYRDIGHYLRFQEYQRTSTTLEHS